MALGLGILLVALALVMRGASLDFAISFAPGWHVTIWPVAGIVGLALTALALVRWR